MNNNKGSTELWINRLFGQSGVSKTVPPSKASYAHRYRDDHAVPERSPFSALFFDAGKDETRQESENDKFQEYFEHKSPPLEVESFTVESESAQFSHANLSQASGDKLDLASGAALSDRFTVLNCYDETPDTKTFRLGVPKDRTFDYLPGQYLTLSIVISGQEYKRSYSLASSPARSKILEITVRRAPDGGLVSNWLNDHLKIGDTVDLKGPFGKFSCINHTHEKILFLAAGSGIVPIMSMLRWLADTEAGADIRLLVSFRTPEDIIYRDELMLIAARHKNINIAITLTTNAIARYQWRGLTGRINKKMIKKLAPDLPERMVYLCGPDAFMVACKKKLLKLNLPSEQLFSESFTVNSPIVKPDDSVSGLLSRSRTGSYQVNFAKSGKTVAADGQTTLLAIAIRYGIKISHSCLSGNCGECMIKCLKGRIEMTDQAEIDDVDRKQGWAYACCAYPASNVVLDG
jgi:ferredoxin-NADP reductase